MKFSRWAQIHKPVRTTNLSDMSLTKQFHNKVNLVAVLERSHILHGLHLQKEFGALGLRIKGQPPGLKSEANAEVS